MSIYRRARSSQWYIRIGREIDRSARTSSRSEALALEAKWRDEIRRREMYGEHERRTFAEAAADWAEDVGQRRRGWDRDGYRLQILVDRIGNRWTNEVTNAHVTDAIPPTANAPASRNAYRSLARSVLRHEAEKGHLPAAPKIRMEFVMNQRVRYLADWAEADRLIAAMPPNWRDPARFTLETGLRLGTLRALRSRWLHGDLLVIPGTNTKSGRQLAIPLSEHAIYIARRQSGADHLFVRQDGHPLGRMEHKTWTRVLKRSKIEDFRWHDLRHTWASWMMMTGEVSLYELQLLGDWSTPAMVQRYAHLAPGYLRSVVRRASAQLPRNVLDSGEIEPNCAGS